MREEKLRKTEQLLLEASDWEPRKAMPSHLAQSALEAALERERLESRRTPRMPVLVALICGGGAVSSAVAGALWAMLMPHGGLAFRPVAPTPHAELAAYPAPAPRSLPGSPKRKPLGLSRTLLVNWSPSAPRRVHLGRGANSASVRSRPMLHASWSTEQVERKHRGVLAPAMLVQPDPSSDTVYLHPGVVDIPVPDSRSACAPLPDEERQVLPEDPNPPVPEKEQRP